MMQFGAIDPPPGFATALKRLGNMNPDRRKFLCGYLGPRRDSCAQGALTAKVSN
jgi:hypothetical protein